MGQYNRVIIKKTVLQRNFIPIGKGIRRILAVYKAGG